jgi:hypothetical protein
MTYNQELYDSTEEWRQTRYNIFNAIYPKGYFKNKTVLEVAAAWGHIGNWFYTEHGANVTCTDYYQKWVDVIQERHPHIRSFILDVNKPWTLDEHFDVLIHMGVIYHQPREIVEDRLKEALQHCNEVIVETDAVMSDDAYLTEYVPRPPAEHAWEPHEMMTEYCRPSVSCITRILTESGFSGMVQQYTGTSYRPDDPPCARFLWFFKRNEHA